MRVPRAAPAGVGEETAHRSRLTARQDFCLRAVSRGPHRRCRGLGDGPAAAEMREYVIVAKIANATIILDPNDNAGTILRMLCNIPITSIIPHATVLNIMIGTPTMMNSTKSFPFTLNTPSLDSQRA